MAERARTRKTVAAVDGAAEVRQLREALEIAERKLAESESKRSRAVARATVELRKENEMLEAQLTRLVQEIGQLRTIVDRVERAELDNRAKDAQAAQLEEELERLRQALRSGRPTAIAAAAASQAVHSRRAPRR